ncbi:methanogenesis marker protein Mmp4/MtxX [Methanococcus voltae]|uniref:Methanogen marker protein 4 n=1 Tax=Methanococcus voltae (strain ATCC BAA-1334 / A3) TaxID=456320 RepID=D7DRE7_METV3|nr:methanogenesis marker protein Mmp4/MtxX [Methanococcus voltae]MCS3901084.1 putative methanogen marker protein 4 [Methanococcus voltae]
MYILGYDKNMESANEILKAYNKLNSENINVKLVESPKKFLKLFEDSLIDDDNIYNKSHTDNIDGFVRGNLSSSKIMPEIKSIIANKLKSRFYRASILKNPFTDKNFILAPVGIDEFSFEYNKRIDDKLEFIDYIVSYLKTQNNTTNKNNTTNIKIGLLSGGRLSDLGRNPSIDNTIYECNDIVKLFEKSKQNNTFYDNVDVVHNGILIEDYLKEGFDVIIAPDGISGNLIFRSLALVCGLEGCGALLTSKKPINFIDTSRSGNYMRYYNAVKYLYNQKNK